MSALCRHVARARSGLVVAPGFTGCGLREILHLKWEQFDFERGLLFLPESKAGKKTVILNAPALEVLNGLDRVGSYVVPGDDPNKPRADLKRPWAAVTKRAGSTGSACTTFGILMRASARAVASGCRSSASCSVTRRHRPPNVTRISTAIRSGGPPNTSVVVSLRRWKGNEVGPSCLFATATDGSVCHGPALPKIPRTIAFNIPCLSGCHPQPLAVVFGHAHGRFGVQPNTRHVGRAASATTWPVAGQHPTCCGCG